MKKLEELVKEYKYSEASDIDIIREYFISNDLEEKAIDMMNDLSRIKMEKLRNKNKIAEEWVCMLPSKYLYQNYKLDVADMLHRLELDYLIHEKELSSSNIKWARENIPNIKKPECYFQPVIHYLEEKGIKFKEW